MVVIDNKVYIDGIFVGIINEIYNAINPYIVK